MFFINTIVNYFFKTKNNLSSQEDKNIIRMKLKRIIVRQDQSFAQELLAWLIVLTVGVSIILHKPNGWLSYLTAVVVSAFIAVLYHIINKLEKKRLFTRAGQAIGLEIAGYALCLVGAILIEIFADPKVDKTIVYASALLLAVVLGTLYHMIVAQREALSKFLVRSVGQKYDELTDKDKIVYTVLGSALFVPVMMSLLSVPYMMQVSFKSVPATIAASLIMSVIIFLIDRSIIATMGAKKSWPVAIVRIAMAGVIAMFLTKPIEMALFSSEIRQELVSQRTDALKAIAEEETSEIERLNKKKNDARKLVDEAHEEYLREVNQGFGTRASGHGKEAEKKLEYEKMERGRYDIEAGKIDTEIVQMRKDYADKRLQWTDAQADGLGARMNALERAGEKYPGIATLEWIVFLFFMLIDITPVIAKMFMRRTDSDSKELDEILKNQKEAETASITHKYSIITHELTQVGELVKLLKDANTNDEQTEQIHNHMNENVFTKYFGSLAALNTQPAANAAVNNTGNATNN